jgi:hypothetical protein
MRLGVMAGSRTSLAAIFLRLGNAEDGTAAVLRAISRRLSLPIGKGRLTGALISRCLPVESLKLQAPTG